MKIFICTTQNFSTKNLVTFTEEILNKKLHILCSDDVDNIISLEMLTHFIPVLMSYRNQSFVFADWFLYEMQR